MGFLTTETVSSNVKKIVNGFLASIGVILIQVTLLLAPFNYFNILSSLILLLLVSFETLMFYIIYLSYNITISEEHLLPDTAKTRIFLKGLLWYIIINASLQIIRVSLLLILSSNIISVIEIISNILYTINLLTSLTIAPLIIYVIIWSLMLYTAVKELNGNSELKNILTATALLMLISIISYIAYPPAGSVVMITALSAQACLFLKISKKADSDSRIKQADRLIKPSRVRKS